MVFGSLSVAACGRTSLPNTEPILRPQESRNQPITAVVVPTTTVDLTATILDQTAIVEGATKEAEYLAFEQYLADKTATSLAELPSTAPPWPTYEPVTPSPTREYRLFAHLECTTDEPGPAIFVTNCWHGVINNKDFVVYGHGIRNKAANNKIVGGSIGVVENDIPMGRYLLPSNTNALTIVQELSPYLVISVGDHYEVLFNLETYQWANLDGTPIPVTATPTSTK